MGVRGLGRENLQEWLCGIGFRGSVYGREVRNRPS